GACCPGSAGTRKRSSSRTSKLSSIALEPRAGKECRTPTSPPWRECISASSNRSGTPVKSNPKSGSFKYSRPMARGIDVTVAAIVESRGRFLMVEERAGADQLVFNQPAGHLERGESLLTAVIREALEETGHRFDPEHVVGFYLWNSLDADTTY